MPITRGELDLSISAYTDFAQGLGHPNPADFARVLLADAQGIDAKANQHFNILRLYDALITNAEKIISAKDNLKFRRNLTPEQHAQAIQQIYTEHKQREAEILEQHGFSKVDSDTQNKIRSHIAQIDQLPGLLPPAAKAASIAQQASAQWAPARPKAQDQQITNEGLNLAIAAGKLFESNNHKKRLLLEILKSHKSEQMALKDSDPIERALTKFSLNRVSGIQVIRPDTTINANYNDEYRVKFYIGKETYFIPIKESSLRSYVDNANAQKADKSSQKPKALTPQAQGAMTSTKSTSSNSTADTKMGPDVPRNFKKK